jgi:hypothetical protein
VRFLEGHKVSEAKCAPFPPKINFKTVPLLFSANINPFVAFTVAAAVCAFIFVTAQAILRVHAVPGVNRPLYLMESAPFKAATNRRCFCD